MVSNLTQWSALVGFALPWLVAVIKQEKWRSSIKTALGVAACAIAAAVTAYFEGKFNLRDWTTSVITIFLMTKTSYLAVWKPTGVDSAITNVTSNITKVRLTTSIPAPPTGP